MGEQERQGYRNIFKRSVQEAVNFFKDSFESSTQGRDIWLRDGVPLSITGKAAQNINRRQCEVWGKNPGAFRPVWAEQLRDICSPYLESKGLTPGSSSAASGFLGGQCGAVRYGATYEWDVNNSGAWQAQNITTFFPGSTQLYGPVSVLGDLRVGAGSTLCTSGTFRGSYEIAGFDSSGQPIQVGLNLGGVGCRSSQSIQVRNLSFLPIGTSQDCGNPPPEYSPGAGYGAPLPPPPKLVPGDPLSPDFDVTINSDGSITITSGDQNITVDPGPDGELQPDDSGEGPGNIAPGDQGTAGDPTGNFDGAAEGEDETANLSGVLVQTVSVPNRANQFFNSFETYTKGPYFVYFGGDGGYSQDPTAALARSEQFYNAPEGCNKWRVVANLGYTLNVTPFYRK